MSSQTFPRVANEAERIEFLHAISLMDSAPDKNLDRINLLAKKIFQVEVAAVTLLDEDRQWFKCVTGLDADGTSREVAVCNHTIMQDDIFEVTDLSIHPDFKDNELVIGDLALRYYAGAPLEINGFKLGSLCIIDFEPREPLSPRERSVLMDLAEMVVREISLQAIVKESLALISSYGATTLPD